MRPDYKPLGGCSNKLKRVTCHESQDKTVRVCKHPNFRRLNHLRGIHTIVIQTAEGRQFDLVTFADLAQTPEECVSVSCDSNISRLTR